MMQFVYSTPFNADIVQRCRGLLRILSNADTAVTELCTTGAPDEPLKLRQVDEKLCATANRLGIPVTGRLRHSRGDGYETVEDFQQDVLKVLTEFREAHEDEPENLEVGDRLVKLFTQLWNTFATIQYDPSQLPPPPWDVKAGASSSSSNDGEASSEASGEVEDEDKSGSASASGSASESGSASGSGSGSGSESSSSGSSDEENEDEERSSESVEDTEDNVFENEDEVEEEDPDDEDFDPKRSYRRKSKSRAKSRSKSKSKSPAKRSRRSLNIVHKSEFGEAPENPSEDWLMYHERLNELASWVEKMSNGKKSIKGWTIEYQRRTKGSRAGSLDMCYYTNNGRKLRSRKEVANFFGMQIMNEVSREEACESAFQHLSGLLAQEEEEEEEDQEQEKKRDEPRPVTLAAPIELKHTKIIDLGVITEDEAYHTKELIYPIGYKSVCMFVNPLNVRKPVPYTNEVIRGETGPRFRITDHKGRVFEGRSCADVWGKVVIRVIDEYRERCRKMAIAVSQSDTCAMSSSTPAIQTGLPTEKAQLELIHREVKRMMTGMITRVQNMVFKGETGDLSLVTQKKSAVPKIKKVKKKKIVSGAKARAITLADLLKAELIKPGEAVVELRYQNSSFTADISPEGKIVHHGVEYETPSAFSIAVKRSINPSKKADDGWKSCIYQGVSLHKYKMQVAESMVERGDEQEDQEEDEEELEEAPPEPSDSEWWAITNQHQMGGKVGQFLFGLDHAEVLSCLEGLPGVNTCCPRYVYRNQRASLAREDAKNERNHKLYHNRVKKTIIKFRKHQDGIERRVEAANRRHMKLEDRFAKNWRTIEKRAMKQKTQAIANRSDAIPRTKPALEALAEFNEDLKSHKLPEREGISEKEKKDLALYTQQLKEANARTEELDSLIEELENTPGKSREALQMKQEREEHLAKADDVDRKLYELVHGLRYRSERDSKRLSMKKALREMSDRLTWIGRSLGDYVQKSIPPDLPDDLALSQASNTKEFPWKLMKPLLLSEKPDLVISIWAFLSSFAPLLGLCTEPPLEFGVYDPKASEEDHAKMIELAQQEVEENAVERKKQEADRKRLRQKRIAIRLDKSTTRKRKKKDNEEDSAAKTKEDDEDEEEDDEDENEEENEEDEEENEDEENEEEEEEDDDEEEEEEGAVDQLQKAKKTKTKKAVFVEGQGRRPKLMLHELHKALSSGDMHLLGPLHLSLVRILFSEYAVREELRSSSRRFGYRDIPINEYTWPELVRLACLMRLEQYVDLIDGSYVTNETEALIQRSSVSYSNLVLGNIDLKRIDPKRPSRAKGRNAPKPLDAEEEVEGRHRKEVYARVMQSVKERLDLLGIKDRGNAKPRQRARASQNGVASQGQGRVKRRPLTEEERHVCRAITREISLDEMALAFCCPVNTDEFEDYLDMVPDPIDLQTIDVKLEAGKYKSLEAFCEDMRRVWTNCKAYNTRGSDIYEIAHRLAAYFEEILSAWLLQPLRGEKPKPRGKQKSRSARAKRGGGAIENPWKDELPAAAWELADNKPYLTIVSPEDLEEDSEEEQEDEPAATGSDGEDFVPEEVEQAPTNGRRERRPRQAKRKAKAAAMVEFRSEESEMDVSPDDDEAVPQPHLDKSDQYFGTVVAKIFDGYKEAFEGVVVGRKAKKFVVRFHVNEVVETFSQAELLEMERFAAEAPVNHEAEEATQVEKSKKQSPKAPPRAEEDESSPLAPPRTGKVEYESRLKLIMRELARKSYDELDYEAKTELLYLLCEEVSETSELHETVERKMGIIVQTRKTWRTNPPIIVSRGKAVVKNEEQERLDHEQENWTHLPGDSLVDELSGGGELELRDLKNELQSFRNDTTVSLTKPLEKAMDRVEREIIDHYKRKDRKMQYKRWKSELEYKVHYFMPRSKLLGCDRFHNRYIHFPDDNCRIFVQPPVNPRRGEKPSEGSLAEWRVLDSRTEISQFLQHLNPKGRREAVLLNRIKSYASILTRGRNWASEAEGGGLDDDLESFVIKHLREQDAPEWTDFYDSTVCTSLLPNNVVDEHVDLCEANAQEFEARGVFNLKVILLNIESICANANLPDWMNKRKTAWRALVIHTKQWRDLRQALAFLEDSFGHRVRVNEWFKTLYGEPSNAVRCKTLSSLVARVLALDVNLNYAPLMRRQTSPRETGRKRKSTARQGRSSKRKR